MPDRSKTELPPSTEPPHLSQDIQPRFKSIEVPVAQTLKTYRSEQDWSQSAQDLLDTLPRAWTKGLLYLLAGLTAIGLPWAVFSKVDETGSAKGRLEPKDRSFRLEAAVAGTVTRIHAKPGQKVKAGQLLLELDSALVQTDLKRTETQLKAFQNQVAQLKLVKSQLDTVHRSHRLHDQVDQVGQHINAKVRSYTLLQNRLTQDLAEVQRYRELWQQGVVPQVKVAEMERIALESRQAVEQTRSELEQTHTDRLDNLSSEITQAQSQLKSLNLQLQQHIVRSPVDGIVFELPIQRTGAVVQPSQLIAQVAPEASPLVLRAQLPSQESGFLKPGMPVKLKFDAYPFQDYGVVQGQLHWISPDSKPVETPQGRTEVFEVEVSLDQDYISGQNKRIKLTPGQTAIAEIIVRERRLIDFVIDPLKQLQRDGLKL